MIKIEGELSEVNIAGFERQLRSIASSTEQTVTLDLSELDIDDGIAVATVVNELRELRARSARLVLVGAPQILGHNLYRVGLLEGKHSIELIDMRSDEPYS
jgi:anti-anti-sigma regulatory factor